MLRTLAIAAAFALAAGAASAQKIDAKGHCHDAMGKMAPMSVCKPAAAAPAANPKQCKKGKPCGNTCISVKDVCHK
jgi:hypothetical protein